MCFALVAIGSIALKLQDLGQYQRYRGLPLTLTAMLHCFHSPPTDSAPVPGPTTTTPDDTPILVVFVAAAGLLSGLHRFRGPHRGFWSDGPRLTR